MRKITPFLWFDGNVREAVAHYASIFPNTKVLETTPGPNGTLMSATLEIEEQQLILFNGGPSHTFTPAISLYVSCETQGEVDALWAKLTDGGAESRCGWLEDRFGLSWQIIPSILPQLLQDRDREKAGRALNAMLGMQKIDIAALERAFAGV